MTTQTVTLTIAQLMNPALLIQALVMQGVDVSTVPYLFWNNIYTGPLRKAIATNQTPDYATNAAKYEEYIKTKYNDAFLAIRESANKPKAQQPTTALESPKTAQNSVIQPMPTVTAQQPTIQPTVTAESMTLAQWLESQYGLSESAVDSVILTLGDSHIETYALLCNKAIESYASDSPLSKSSRAYKAQTSAIRKAIASESSRRKVYVDYMNTSATPAVESAVETATPTAPTAPTTPAVDNNMLLMLAEQMKQQGELLARLMAQANSVK